VIVDAAIGRDTAMPQAANPNDAVAGHDATVTLRSRTADGTYETLFATQLGGSALDAAGDGLRYGGSTSTPLLGTSGALQELAGGDADAFSARISSDLTTLHERTYLGGSMSDSQLHAADDGTGRVNVLLSAMSHELPVPGAGTAYAGDRDFYWAALDPRGASLEHGSFFGSASDDIPWGGSVTTP
jgi:hypothetical protein